ncbi:MAG: hypothetical protein HC899_37900 [Leptolyngbyaceae cyanobacterium SM1_4_3]|nr:hypothetical protein [Leptolyngbyaceae cyanobacterium SM1_4_3]
MLDVFSTHHPVASERSPSFTNYRIGQSDRYSSRMISSYRCVVLSDRFPTPHSAGK